MPKETFLNLSTEKKEWMDLILLDNFYNQPISQVKVSQIVTDMQMSRGAFYKYFDDLDDAYLYIVKKYAMIIHIDIQRYINRYKEDYFYGLQQYLIWCSQMDQSTPYWKAIYLLTTTSSQPVFKRVPMNQSGQILKDWQAVLDLNHFDIFTIDEALSFLYFSMELVMRSLSDFIINDWQTEELIKDFQFKSKWLKNGLKKHV
ncbi:TetR family transcriptional regulator [Vagococcus penaei]|uniref:TetR family transcriptional regulator n=1 Tax=Vagococcus penaei TaxID=633807 RepID=A0A1Q2D4T5_9ENTE|nr:TetR/AcrR family transcriptional regulator [Vagococcus penaei]AQP53369.1 TetR family transcriptional regulator [Vagococcus penaei]RST99692.1 TetR family transcriptional regulator [Vagococcus penaei]